jgi:hypothetical protein
LKHTLRGKAYIYTLNTLYLIKMARVTCSNLKMISVKLGTWSRLMEMRLLVQRKDRKGLETVDEVIQRLLGVDAK